MGSLSFCPVEISYCVVDGSPVVEVFGRDGSGESVVVLDYSFVPYLWVFSKDLDGAKDFISKQVFKFRDKSFSVKGFEVHDKIFNGDVVKCLKVFVDIPSFVPVVRDFISSKFKVLEADILFTRRYFIDKQLTPFVFYDLDGEFVENDKYDFRCFSVSSWKNTGKDFENFKVLAFDIETYNSDGLIPEAEKDPIIMASLVGKGFKRVITYKKFEDPPDYVVFVDDERELLGKFVELIKEFNPDFISGYFSDGFDLPYLEKRSSVLKCDFNLGVDSSGVRVGKSRFKVSDVKGFCHFDVLNFIRRVLRFSLKTPVYDLDSVSRELLGKGKKQINILDAYKLWDGDGEGVRKLCDYNLQDSVLVFELVEKILVNAVELAKLIGLPLFDSSRFSFSQLVEWYLLRVAFSKNVLAPNKPDYDEANSRRRNSFEGAFVFEPKPGLYDDVVVFDFRSLYPSIISSHNISPETINASCSDDDKVFFPDDSSKWVCKSGEGFVSGVIENIVRRRSEVKELIKKNSSVFLESRSLALKILANSVYGYLAYDNSRWYSNDCAALTTSLGRTYIKKVSSDAESAGFSIVYGDTDSIFLTFKGKSRDDVFDFVSSVNEGLPGIMELEFEGFYSKGLFVSTRDEKDAGAKKKYALLSEDGSLKIAGFEAVRRNLSVVAKEVQREVLNLVLKDGDGKAAFDFVKKVVQDVKDRKVSNDRMVISVQLQRDPSKYESVGPHVAVAKLMEAKGIKVGAGNLIRFIVSSIDSKTIRDKARIPEDVKEGDYDVDYYVKNQIVPVVDRILGVFGFSSEQLLGDSIQKKLF